MSSWWKKAGKGFGKILATASVGYLFEKIVDAIPGAIKKRKREKNRKALESKIDEVFQNIKKEMKALHEDFIKLKSKESEEIRAELKKIPEQEIARILESMLNMSMRQLSRRIQTLEQDVKEWPESTKDELQLLRADLEKKPENKEEEIVRTLESMLNMRMRQLSRRIQTLEQDVKEWPESTKDELQLHRAYLEMNKENKEEEIARAPKSNLYRRLLFRRIPNSMKTVQQSLEAKTACSA